MRTRPNIAKPALTGLVIVALIFGFAAGATAQSDEMTLTSGSVGSALVGSTIDELSDQLGSDFEIGDEVRITVDFNGHVISRNGEVQFRAVKANAPGDELSLFIVNNNEFATADGVGPGTTIADAEDIYGEATLSWNAENEGREFVSFANQPEGRIAFRTPGIAGTNVGIYGDGEFETTEYEDDGVIAAVWISCVPGTDCPADTGVVPGAANDDDTDDDTEEAEPTPTATPTPEPEPEPTEESEPEPEPEPIEEPEDDEAPASSSSSNGADRLADTGFEETLLVTLASTLILLGGSMTVFRRHYLAPAWLRSRRPW